jgi:hypothetical protein
MALPPPECDERGVFYPVWKAMELPAEFGYTTLLWLHDFIGLEIILAH